MIATQGYLRKPQVIAAAAPRHRKWNHDEDHADECKQQQRVVGPAGRRDRGSWDLSTAIPGLRAVAFCECAYAIVGNGGVVARVAELSERYQEIKYLIVLDQSVWRMS
jgi:hypothetical protein